MWYPSPHRPFIASSSLPRAQQWALKCLDNICVWRTNPADSRIITCPHHHTSGPRCVLSTHIQPEGLNPSFIPSSRVYAGSMGRQIQLGVFTLPRMPPCAGTQTKYTARNQTAELLWRSVPIIPQVPTLFYAWISAPESTNRWLLVLCAHEGRVRAVKWSLSAS